MRDPKDPATVIPHLRIGEVDALKNTGIIDKGMIPKVDGALAAVRAGVEKVSFVDGRLSHGVLLEIFTKMGVGTEVVL
jgi:acetylglutamate kinase